MTYIFEAELRNSETPKSLQTHCEKSNGLLSHSDPLQGDRFSTPTKPRKPNHSIVDSVLFFPIPGVIIFMSSFDVRKIVHHEI